MNINKGQYINTGETICNILNKAETMIQLTAYEKDLPYIKKGDLITFTVNGISDRTFSAVIYAIDQMVDQKKGSISVYAKAKESDKLFRQGMYVNAIIKKIVTLQSIQLTSNDKSKYILFKNAISLLVAFATNLPELIAPNNVKWTYVANEILFTYISILILFIINEKIFRPNSPATNLSKTKILASFVVAWICNDILGQCFVFINKYYGLPALESTMHVYTHPIRDFIISSIVVTAGYLINQNLKTRR